MSLNYNSIKYTINNNFNSKSLKEINDNLQKIIKINNDLIDQTIGVINQNFSFYNNSSPLTIEKELKELYIFQRKINIVIQKVINFSIIENNKQSNELKNIMNAPQPYLVNKKIINLKKFNSEKYNLYPEKSKKIQANTNEIERSLIINNYTENINKHKTIYFCIKKNIIKKHIIDLQFNNEIKVLKNNKVVYMNKNLLHKYSTARGIKKLKKINFIITKKRSSKYRGVSKNGNKWQALIMINNKSIFLGNYSSEELAARIYDIQAIKAWGIKAKTNFIYDNNQLKKIYNKNLNIKCDGISDIIDKINN